MTHFILYQTTNTLNGMIYVGAHQTDNIDDSYLGSGTRLKNAIAKHGKDNFKRMTLSEYHNREDLLEAEKALVDQEFIKRSDTYNIRPGGTAGFKGVVPPPYDRKASWNASRRMECSKRNKGSGNPFYGKTHSESTKKILSNKCGRSGNLNGFSGRTHSIETKEKLSVVAKNRTNQIPPPPQKGANNYFSKRYILISPDGTTYHIKCKREFCKEKNLCEKILQKYTNQGIIPKLSFERPYRIRNLTEKLNCQGWSISSE